MIESQILAALFFIPFRAQVFTDSMWTQSALCARPRRISVL